MPRSAVSNRLLADIARDDHGDVEKAATGDPAPPKPAKVEAAKSRRPRGKKFPREIRRQAGGSAKSKTPAKVHLSLRSLRN